MHRKNAYNAQSQFNIIGTSLHHITEDLCDS